MIATKEREPQRSTNKKRNGESSEDWRRGSRSLKLCTEVNADDALGAEPTRAGRDERMSCSFLPTSVCELLSANCSP